MSYSCNSLSRAREHSKSALLLLLAALPIILRDRTLFIMAITSQLRSTNVVGDVPINEWQAAGLLKPSAIKPVFATLEQSIILARLGALGLPDQAALRDAIAAILR